MRKERKQYLLGTFPAVPSEIEEQMYGKGARNFAVFLTHGDELYARCYHRYTKGELVERQRYVFAKDGCCRYGSETGSKWTIRHEFREPVFCSASYGYSFDNSYTVLNMETISQSCMKYSLADKYANHLLMEYMRLYCRHPNIEYLLKSGYDPIEEVVSGYWGGKVSLSVSKNINWKSNNLLKMLGLNRTEFAVLKGNKRYYDMYIYWRRQYPKYKPEELLALSKVFGYEHGTVERFCEATGLKPQRIARYLSENNILTHDYSDYIDQCRELHYDMHDTAICIPHDFQTMHERLSAIITFNTDNELRQSFAEHYSERKILEYSSGNLILRQPESIDEIEAEGSLLHHCVGGYAKRHANGKLHILFIRTADKPDVSYYTMELSISGKIVQVRGLRNCNMTPEVEFFVEQYKLYIAEIFSKKERKTA